MKIKLEDVCQKDSSNLKQADVVNRCGNYPVFGASGQIGNVDFYHQDRPYIAVVKDGAGIGRTTLCPARSSVIGTMQYLLPKENVLPEYLYYVVRHMNLGKYFTGATIPHIYFRDYRKKEFEYVPLNKQMEIVNILSKLEQTINMRQKELQKLDELVKARFVEMFGDLKSNSREWPIVNFTECAQIDTNMVHNFDKYKDLPHIGIDSIEKDTGRLSGYRTVAEDCVISGKYLFTDKHIIYSKIRPNLNKVALPDFEGLCSADAYPILPKNTVCVREYLAYVMRGNYFLDYILAFSNRTNLPKVNKKQVEGFVFPLPPFKLQQRFADFVVQVDKSKAVVQRQIKDLQELFDKKMDEYFGGDYCCV